MSKNQSRFFDVYNVSSQVFARGSYKSNLNEIIIIIIWVFCPRADPSLQAQELRLQFCRRQVFYRELRNQGCSFTRCGSFPLLPAPHSLFSIWTNLKRSEKIPGALTWKWGEWIWLTSPSGLHRSSQHGLNISSIRVFDQIGDPNHPSPPQIMNFKQFIE